jgi:UDP-N-acetylglucosamine 2-epimerase (non-hydrolysing)
MLKIHLIAAARPNFMKIAPLYHELVRTRWSEPRLVHTGQHYDANMSDAFFRDLNLPRPHFHLEIGSGSHAQQTGGVMIAYEDVARLDRPDVIVVVGDVNSTAACAMVGAKLWIPVVHLEAGLRSGDRRMPEEINRLVTDAIADVLWTPSQDASANLRREGVEEARISLVGNVMIDSLVMMHDAIQRDGTQERLGVQAGGYAVVTLHRPSNVDDRNALTELVTKLLEASRIIPLVFTVHPRTRKRLTEFGLLERLERSQAIRTGEPLGYIQFMNLVAGAAAVITDSGGVQEETTYLGIPCLTLRDNTERPVTITQGTNRLVSVDALGDALQHALVQPRSRTCTIPYWDGATARRCVADLQERFAQGVSH